jgi:EAL domain-containing protein (putative c-di-GMP-specific phosphodiesterase class I)
MGALQHMDSLDVPPRQVACRRCAQRAPAAEGPGTLFVRLPEPAEAHAGRVIAALRAIDCKAYPYGPMLALDIRSADLHAPLDVVQSQLRASERDATRVAFRAAGRELSLSDAIAAETITTFQARLSGGWLHERIASNELSIGLSAVVRASGARRGYGWSCEVTARGARGERVGAQRLAAIALASSQACPFDHAARVAALAAAAARKVSGALFVDLAAHVAEQPCAMLDATLREAERHGIARERIVLCISGGAAVADPAALAAALDPFRRLGLRVALDGVGSGYGSLNLLRALWPDFVRLDASLVEQVERDQVRAVLVEKLVEASSAIGIRTLAGRVQTEAEAAWLSAHGIDYLQGPLFDARSGRER